MPQTALSHHFLYTTQTPGVLSDRGTAFLGSSTGFLPPGPLPPLPFPYSQWATAGTGLPEVCRSGEWQQFVHSFPDVSAEELPDAHLLRANAYLGAVAHALQNIAQLTVPDKVMKPWTAIGERLERPCASFNSLDWFIYNFELVHPRFVQRVGAHDLSAELSPDTKVVNVWQQTKPHLTVTGCMTETHFITGCYAIEHAARKLPGVVVNAQQAVVQCDDDALRDALVQVIQIVEEMTVAFVSADLRPLSRTYIDPVEWGRCIGDVGLPVVTGEKTISGLLFPSIHLLDVFFSRRAYKTEMGVLEKTDRKWLPPLHRRFLDAVAQVSVLEYIDEHARSEELRCIFARAVSAFASESGFLGKHRIRIVGLLELAMKVGRSATAAGTATVTWQNRVWKRINRAMLHAMQERLQGMSHLVHTATVQLCEPIAGEAGSAHRLVLDTKGALIYSPGDHIAIWPENSEALVKETLVALELDPSHVVTTGRRTWIEAFRDRGFDVSDGLVQASAEQFLRFATLQPFNRDLGQRLAASLFVSNPALRSYLSQERATNLPIAIRMCAETGIISVKHLSTCLDTLLEPLACRYYSISSHMSFTPNSVEVCVGSVRYEPQTSLSFKYCLLPWRKSERVCICSPTENGKHLLSRYISKTPTNPKSAEKVPESSLPSQTLALFRRRNLDQKRYLAQKVCATLSSQRSGQPTEKPSLVKHLVQKGWATLSGQPNSTPGEIPNFTMKARSRAEVLCYEFQRDQQQDSPLRGVSSSFLSQLEPGSKVRVQVTPEQDFHIPQDPQVPIAMISLGTGVAPFRSFMKELIRQKPKDGTPCRTAWLILGVTSKDKIPFLEDIEEAVCKHKVMSLSVALSREDVDLDISPSSTSLSFRQGRRKRIQGLFEEDPTTASKLWNMLSAGGHIYACGRPDLEPIIRQLVSFTVKRFAHALWSSTFFDTNKNLQSLAEEFADRLAAERRLHIDAYQSGGPAVTEAFFSAADVAQHRTPESCWVIFRDQVYDISKYLAVHPGGGKVLLDKAGRDMTTDFDEVHGRHNLRIASMIEPYKIGQLEPFRKSSERLKDFMNTWSVPLLHGVMEHRSVLLLDINEFPALREPSSFVAWKSHASGPDGLRNLQQKFWDVYEPHVFEYLIGFLRPAKLDKLLRPFSQYLGGIFDCDVLVAEIEKQRLSFLQHVVKEEDESDAKSLWRFQHFMDGLVETCIETQLAVERALRCPLSNNHFEAVYSFLIAGIIQALKRGVDSSYSILATEHNAPENHSKDIE